MGGTERNRVVEKADAGMMASDIFVLQFSGGFVIMN